MSVQTIERPTEADVDLAARFPGKYVSLTSFKRDGTGVATPMWFVVDGDRLLAMTDANSLKVKRIRRNPAVTIAPCRGDGKPRGEPMAGTAELLPASTIPRVEALMRRKYRLDMVTVLPIYRLVRRLRGHRDSGDGVVIAVDPR
jgi:PPOX class probable F420-dependent enzyme